MENNKNKRKWKKFSPEEKQWITENYTKLSLKEIAEKWNRSVGSIKSLASVWGIHKKIWKTEWTKEQLKFLIDNAGKLTAREIEETINIKRSTVQKKLADLNLPNTRW